jgi:hypothetical protein
MKKHSLCLILAFFITFSFSQMNGQSAMAEVDEPLAPNSASPNWQTPQKISQTSGITGAVQPSLEASLSGAKVIVVYNGIIGGSNADRDVFYATSTNYGQTWPTKGQIHSSPGQSTDSFLVDIAIAPNNKGHAVWREEVGNIPRIVYKYEDNWGTSTSYVTVSNAVNPVVVSEPRIVAKSNSRLDVVWSQGEPSTNVNIYHAYSLNSNGSSWQGRTAIANTSPSSRLPDIAIDASGNYHVVWEEGTNPKTIYYLRGVASGNSINWALPPQNISQRSITSGDAVQPRIYADGNVLHVTFSNYNSINSQFVHHLQCNSNCSTVTNWISVGNPVSGQVLSAKATDPFDVNSTVAKVGQCTFVYFHGIQGSNTTGNEQIWGTNSCGNWASSIRDQVTDTTVRAINPTLDSANNWWLFLSYEQVIPTTGLREIYFVRNKPALYLPMIRK